MEDTDEYRLRDICRWYSETYATPLWVVEYELPIEHVLQHYYEVQYHNMNHISRRDAARLLIESAKEKEDRLKKAEDDKRRSIEFGQSIFSGGALEKIFKNIKGPKPGENVPSDSFERATKEMLKGAGTLKELAQGVNSKRPPPEAPMFKDIESNDKPEIEMKFGSLVEDDFDLFAPAKKKK